MGMQGICNKCLSKLLDDSKGSFVVCETWDGKIYRGLLVGYSLHGFDAYFLLKDKGSFMNIGPSKFASFYDAKSGKFLFDLTSARAVHEAQEAHGVRE